MGKVLSHQEWGQEWCSGRKKARANGTGSTPGRLTSECPLKFWRPHWKPSHPLPFLALQASQSYFLLRSPNLYSITNSWRGLYKVCPQHLQLLWLGCSIDVWKPYRDLTVEIVRVGCFLSPSVDCVLQVSFRAPNHNLTISLSVLLALSIHSVKVTADPSYARTLFAALMQTHSLKNSLTVEKMASQNEEKWMVSKETNIQMCHLKYGSDSKSWLLHVKSSTL